MKFFERPDSKKQIQEWRQRLRREKFPDIEDSKERLKSPDKRTIAFENQEIIRDFFLTIDALLTHYPEMPRTERKIMALYSRGVYIRTIAKQIRKSERYVYLVLRRYRGLILAFERIYAPAENPPSLSPQSNAGLEALDGAHETKDQAA